MAVDAHITNREELEKKIIAQMIKLKNIIIKRFFSFSIDGI
jgi:hypothetical protein